jgi:hypothetical protein
MKTMTCKEIGGACDQVFHAETFDEIAEMSKQHGKEMFIQQDEKHMKVMQEMMELMQDPEAMEEWMANKKKEFDALPDDE